MSTRSFWYQNQRGKKSLFKKLAAINGLLFIIQISFGSLFFVGLPVKTTAVGPTTFCPAPVDVVMIFDRSGSMADTSRCICYNAAGVRKVLPNSGSISEEQCESGCRQTGYFYEYTVINPTKFNAAKTAANSFLDLMGAGDQSALVSFATNVTLNKELSSDHNSTKTAVNGLSHGGATNIGDAIHYGTQELGSVRVNQQANKVMILLTDGMANKPNGPGYDEFPADVAYAEAKAADAAALGLKIFTIGLGSDGDINETMLQNIADTTGADYFHAPSQNDLNAIYQAIASKICEYSSISGLKWLDLDKDGTWDGTETGLLPGWEIVLAGPDDLSLTQITDANGYYQFSGLEPGAYTLTETLKPGWVQTYPASGSHIVNITDWNQHLTSFYFGNYEQPAIYCGDGLVNQDGEICDNGQANGQVCAAEYGLTCDYCGLDCQIVTVTGPFCGDNAKNGLEECDGQDGLTPHHTCLSCQLVYVPYCGDSNVDPEEVCEINDTNSCTAVSGYQGIQGCLSDCSGWNECIPQESCGDGVINNSEQCDGQVGVPEHYNCTPNCTLQYVPYCGDNIVNQEIEQCDGTSGVPEHYICSAECTLAAVPYCGDGQTNQTSEQCDSGQSNGTLCTPAYGQTCNYCDLTCQNITLTGAFCGDGKLAVIEQCDDGNTTSGDGCSSACISEGSGGPVCGNNILETGEQCDTGQANGQVCTPGYGQTCDYCNSSCQTTTLNGPSCGDEQCNNEETCSTCPGDCGGCGGGPVCGDGSCNGEESCSICPSDCGSCSSGGGGGGNSTPLCVLTGTCNTASVSSAPPIVAGEISQPKLEISKTIDRKSANPGEQNIKYTIIIKNTGNLTAFNVEVTDELPEGLQRTDDKGLSMTWRIGDLNPGNSQEIKYSVNIAKEAKAMVYKNIATAKADNHDPVTAGAELEVKAVKVLAETGFNLNEFWAIFLSLAILIGATRGVRLLIKPDINS